MNQIIQKNELFQYQKYTKSNYSAEKSFFLKMFFDLYSVRLYLHKILNVTFSL